MLQLPCMTSTLCYTLFVCDCMPCQAISYQAMCPLLMSCVMHMCMYVLPDIATTNISCMCKHLKLCNVHQHVLATAVCVRCNATQILMFLLHMGPCRHFMSSCHNVDAGYPSQKAFWCCSRHCSIWTARLGDNLVAWH